MKDVNAIKGASVGVKDNGREDTLARWETAIKESNVDRKIRHVITGNLLQAFSAYKGKLVSYTMMDGSVKKGILMPEHWNPGNETQQKTDVPILRALKVIRSLTTGQQVTASNSISIFRQAGGYKLITTSSRARSGDIFLDFDLLSLVDGKNFEKVSDKMVATVQEDNL